MDSFSMGNFTFPVREFVKQHDINVRNSASLSLNTRRLRKWIEDC